MARVPYIDAIDGVSPPDLVTLYHDIAGLRGTVHNLHRVLANQPAALRAFMVMSRYIRDDAELPADLRELAVLATGHTLQVAYEIHHHIPAARRAGVSEAKIAAFPDWRSADVFTPQERAVLAYATELAERRQVTDTTWAALQAALPLRQITDLTLTIGWYHLCTVVLNAVQIDIEGQSAGHSVTA